MSKPHGHSIDDYLEAIHLLVSPIGVYEPAKAPAAIAARVADALGVSRTAVGEMLKRLMAEGLLETGTGRALVLTEAGTQRAESVVRRNRIVERFLTDMLGYNPAGRRTSTRRVSGRGSRTTWSSDCTRSSGIRSGARTVGPSPRNKTAKRAWGTRSPG